MIYTIDISTQFGNYTTTQASTLSLPMWLPILIVLVLHSPLTSCPSQIAGKGEELLIRKGGH